MAIPTNLAQVSEGSNREKGRHVVQFYTDEAVLLASVATRLGAALMAGDAAIVFATEEHRQGILEQFRIRGLDTTAAIEEGRYIARDAAETISKFMLDGAPDSTLFSEAIATAMDEARSALAVERGRIAAFGEMVALLWADGHHAAALKVEKLWNRLAQERPFSLHCAYPISAFHETADARVLREICAEHSGLIELEDRSEALFASGSSRTAPETAPDEQEQTRDALRRANERLRGIFSSATVGIAILALDTRIQDANAAFCGITGYAREELRSLSDLNVTHPDDCAPMNPLLRKLVAGLIPSFALEKRYIRKSGKMIWVRNSISLVRNAKGEPEHLLVICEDISKQKHTEALLQAQKRILEMIARGEKMTNTLSALVQMIEDQSTDGVLGSILVRGEAGQMTASRFVEGVAPSIGETYISALRNAPITPPYLGPCARAVHLGESVITADLAHDPRWSPIWRDSAMSHGLRTCYSSPIFSSSGAAIGSFAFYYKQARASAIPQEKDLLATATSLAGIAIEKAFSDETLRRNEAQLAADLADSQLLQRISGELIREDNIGALHQKIMDAATELMHADCASMQMLDPERNELELIAWKGFHPDSAAHWKWVPHDSGSSCSEAIRTGQRVIVEDVDQCEFIVSTPDYQFYRLSEMRSVQSTPLLSRSGRLLGMISTHWRQPHRPSEREFGLLDVLARQAADLLEHRVGNEALQHREGQFRAIFEQTTGGIAQTDLAGHFIMVNDRYCEITGRTRAELTKLCVQNITHPDDLAENLRQIAPLVEGSQRNFVIEKRYVRPDGSDVWVRNHISAIQDEHGRPVSLVGAVTDVTEEHKVEEELRKAKESLEERVLERTAEMLSVQRRLQALSARLLQTQDEERRRIARELHDSVGQQLAVLKMDLSMLPPLLAKSQKQAGQEILAETVSLIDECITETRTISYLLHPPLLDELGIASAVRWYVDGFSKRCGIEARVDIAENLKRLPASLELSLFRILQEALTNVHRHSRSPSVEIHLACESQNAVLSVRDFGCGIPADKLAQLRGAAGGGVGFSGMRERVADLAGELQIQSDGNGTVISARIPLQALSSPSPDSDVSRSAASASD